jgi:regulator of PEP synthase PpsR (kinase-PPPase family)
MISDSTGETISSALRATVAMFKDVKVSYRRHVMIRSAESLDEALEAIAKEPGLVFHTVVEADLRARLERRCHEIGVLAVPFLDPLLSTLTAYFGISAAMRPGAQHAVDERYYSRVAALDFAMAYDDGNAAERMREADAVLIGVSRTSKTPTCVYLAVRGVKAANVPLIPGQAPPEALMALGKDGPVVVGLTAKPSRLALIRQNRIEALSHDRATDYADLEAIKREVIEARQLMERLDCPIIDVTRRSIEETSAAILQLVEARRAEKGA